ncbi:MAG: ParB/RepB/Spo0J family partition protein [Candidatus Solibacter sp.]|nr:ParB/RepB/Spo0J family partition protein [Candidatus Solibacter sp.]
MSKPEHPRQALGKGMGALLPTRTHTPPPAPVLPTPAEPRESSLGIPIDQIQPNPLQPRRVFQDNRLEELAQSIRANGIIQPLVVRYVNGHYQLVAGERRWRAAKLAGMATVPVVVREIPDNRLLEITLIENIQREDLNPMETASAFARMSAELNLNAETIGLRTGKDRTTVINLMRLLQLPPDIQQLISDGRLTAGHGRCLLSLPNADLQREVSERAIAGTWSVRQIERTCARMTAGKTPKHVDEVRIDPNVKAAIQEMERKLGTRIHVKEGARGRGRIEIEYYSAEDLDRIYDTIMGEA